MKVWRRIAVLLMMSVGPVLVACEDCLLPGMTDPVGNRVESAQCWSSPQGVSEGCLPKEDGRNCTLWSYGNTCPESNDTGGGPGGGGGFGGGSGCSTTTTGACPPECFSCSGGGGGFLR